MYEEYSKSSFCTIDQSPCLSATLYHSSTTRSAFTLYDVEDHSDSLAVATLNKFMLPFIQIVSLLFLYRMSKESLFTLGTQGGSGKVLQVIGVGTWQPFADGNIYRSYL